MRMRTIAAALVVAASLLALGSPPAAACWERGYRYGYSSPAYYRGYSGIGIRRVGYRAVGFRRVGYRAVGFRRVGVGRRRW
jgi:hypothetical protein